MIDYTCPHCGRPDQVPDHLAGRVIDCSACLRPLTLPEAVGQPGPVTGWSMSPRRHASRTTHPLAGLGMLGIVLMLVAVFVFFDGSQRVGRMRLADAESRHEQLTEGRFESRASRDRSADKVDAVANQSAAWAAGLGVLGLVLIVAGFSYAKPQGRRRNIR